MTTRITITKRFNENELTTEKGCFNCSRHESGKCILTRDGKPIDVMEILTNPNGIKYRCGCCCADYLPYKEKVVFI